MSSFPFSVSSRPATLHRTVIHHKLRENIYFIDSLSTAEEGKNVVLRRRREQKIYRFRCWGGKIFIYDDGDGWVVRAFYVLEKTERGELNSSEWRQSSCWFERILRCNRDRNLENLKRILRWRLNVEAPRVQLVKKTLKASHSAQYRSREAHNLAAPKVEFPSRSLAHRLSLFRGI